MPHHLKCTQCLHCCAPGGWHCILREGWAHWCCSGGAKKRSSDGNLKEFCVQIPGERRVSCPCFLSQQGCKNCNCLNCGNYFGKQEQSTSKTELQENGKKRQNREEQFVQKNRVNSLELISQSSIDLTASTSWCESETLLFEVMLDKLGDQVNNNDVSYLTATYNTLCNLINSNALPFPVNNKTKKTGGREVETLETPGNPFQGNVHESSGIQPWHAVDNGNL